MQYTKEITFTKNGSLTNQISSTIKAARGVIHKIDIVFPPGCFGLVKVQLFLGGHPIAPSTTNMSYSGDSEAIIIPEFIHLRKDFNLITITGFNEDDTDGHTILFRIYVLPEEILLPTSTTSGILESLKALVLRPIVLKQEMEERK